MKFILEKFPQSYCNKPLRLPEGDEYGTNGREQPQWLQTTFLRAASTI